MMPAIYEQLVQTLRREPLPLTKLHAFAVDAGSTWSVEQLHLLVAYMDGIEVEESTGADPMVRVGQRSQQEELSEAIAEVVRAQGRPVPAAQVLQLLPRKFNTSVEQIRKIARETRGLKALGPGLIGLDS
jgi:nucleotide-binding universal stress UspA family protein